MGRKIREENQTSPVDESEDRSTEQKLVEDAQNGDKRAFGNLVRRHQKRLFRYIYGLLGSFDATEDIVQEAFIKAYTALESFRPDYPFYPWLSTIARNLAYNQISREAKKESLDDLHEKGLESHSADLGPMEKLLNSENQKRFYQTVLALPTKYRTVFVLRHFEQMDYTRIASYL
ncbi:MAG: RNA polymerase sigma factor, partial [candidate division Zixibacteria bacterium]|nr:RNA polymerase sigma factor [candidate division Zixibacteria bacterium]